MSYKTYKLSEIADVQTGPFGSQLHKEDYVDDGTPIITVEHLGENKILYQNLPRVGEDDYIRLSKYHLKTDDIVFSRVGSVDRRALVSENENGWMFSGRCLRVRVTDSSVNPKYLSYLFGTQSFKEYIRSIAVGATMPSINTKILSDIEVDIPSLDLQNRVVDILYKLDLKIWNNDDLINNLELIAQTLFKHWFIDYEFPNEEGLSYKSNNGKMVDSELGKIPEGWYMSDVENFSEYNIITGKTPSTKKTEYYDQKGTPFITIPDMHGKVYVTKTNRYLSVKGVESQKNKTLPKNSVCVSCIATPGLVVITTKDSQTNQQINSFTPKYENLYYVYFSLKGLSDHIRDLGSSGSTTLNLNKMQFSKISIIKPSDVILRTFSEVIEPLFKQIKNLMLENEVLEELRDTLIPKLLSGEIEIRDESVVG
jgi:type I restriction enzyme, S subunit